METVNEIINSNVFRVIRLVAFKQMKRNMNLTELNTSLIIREYSRGLNVQEIIFSFKK